MRMRFQDPKVCGARDFARMVATVILNALKDADIARCGVVMLNEMTGVGLRNLDPSIPKYLFGTVFPRLPVRVGRMVLFNPPFLVGRILLPVIKAFMSAKLRQRLVLINSDDTSQLSGYILPASLPQELGGSFPFDLHKWVDEVRPAV
jgi:hypothetical protein